LPGTSIANPYVNVPPDDLRRMLKLEKNMEEKKKMMSALKQWERLYVFPGYPYRQASRRVAAAFIQKLSEVPAPLINMNYYQDTETPQGQEEIIDSLKGLYDNYDNEKENYTRQGERPVRDIDTGRGDFLTPTESPMGGPTVKDKGDGPDPDGLDYNDPPTGGDIDSWDYSK
jgi:hypothetical protein